MKKFIILTFSVIGIYSLTMCAPKSSVAKTSAAPGDIELTAGKAKFPDLTLAELIKGYSIYHGACTNCHRAKNITERSEEKWIGVLNAMAPKAKLTEEEKDAVWKYIMATKLAVKSN
ncbi:MAG TPA: hypothetical protein VK835_13070 [Bacteroidia bacterium]|jgi:hypothetical protein|nr:hypothetical protein [Bacteroidia bacterium]